MFYADRSTHRPLLSSCDFCFWFVMRPVLPSSYLPLPAETVFFCLSYRSVSFKLYLGSIHFLDGQNLVAVSPLTLLKSLNSQFPISFISCFPLATSQNFISFAWIRWKVHMNDVQCHIIFCYFSDTVCIDFVNAWVDPKVSILTL